MSVVIPGPERPYGVLGAHSRQARTFSEHDTHFLQAVANLLAAAIERKQVEEALRSSEARFKLAVTSSPFPTFIHADDGNILLISQVVTDITGYTHDEISTIQDWMKAVYSPKARVKAETAIAKLYDIDERVNEGEFTLTTKQGERRIWAFSSARWELMSKGDD